MSIATANGTFLAPGAQGQAVSFTGQVLAPSQAGMLEVAYIGTAQFTLDGSSTSATLNFIDGTNAPLTLAGTAALTAVAPTAVPAIVIGGTQPAAAFISVSTDTITTTGCTVRFSIAGSNTNTVKILFFIMR